MMGERGVAGKGSRRNNPVSSRSVDSMSIKKRSGPVRQLSLPQASQRSLQKRSSVELNDRKFDKDNNNNTTTKKTTPPPKTPELGTLLISASSINKQNGDAEKKSRSKERITTAGRGGGAVGARGVRPHGRSAWPGASAVKTVKARRVPLRASRSSPSGVKACRGRRRLVRPLPARARWGTTGTRSSSPGSSSPRGSDRRGATGIHEAEPGDLPGKSRECGGCEPESGLQCRRCAQSGEPVLGHLD
ncbi:unnamed protein product [Bemisia tabaci]|uniref:Uncharacterized protein n=1 Tax=Bemisia tabaci TaxID=7038 RepID=A0A9P0AKJ3_BEMTA|nr:unnamed protein product [Bemisia tabaci]